jgi:beta-phosphoglucomutase family hydrolase
VLGLPDDIGAALFDLDGVITQTATIHAAAWKQMFDEFLRARDGAGFAPFTDRDYTNFVDGKPREAGTRDFLASRGITLPPSELTRLGDEKNALVLAKIAAGQVEVFPGSITYLHKVREAGLKTAIVSSSANCREVLASVGIEDLFDVRVDGLVAKQDGLAGKPAPDTFLAAAQRVGVPASRAAVFEDALAGVAAGRAGAFGFVVGVNRAHQADQLREHGADVVVDDLGDLLEPGTEGYAP